MEELTWFLFNVLGFCLTCYVIFAYVRRYSRLKAPVTQRPLVVVAHPDDETMFFGPTLVNMCRQRSNQLHILCLSTGDYRNQGQIRKRELYEATNVLGVKPENITVLKYTKLKDDPAVRWREDLVSEAILHTVLTHNCDSVFSFDRGGVSGHKNHTSVFNAFAILNHEKKLPRSVRIYCLQSVNLLRKYSLLFDVPMSFIFTDTAYVASIKDWWKIQRAMFLHYSQYTWYRKLYMLFSRYVLINTYDQMENNNATK